ncbi:MAG TPA: Rnase Y domain-containing protein, partial [Gemmatimonadales bacterium]|nr:Rnase Y domain-containing protein [Gemmatimonadales bacterium]
MVTLADLIWNIESALIGVVAGLVVGIPLFVFVLNKLGHSVITRAKADADKLRADASSDAKAVIGRAELEAAKAVQQQKEKFEAESGVKREELRETERRLAKREDLVDRKLESLTAKEEHLDKAAVSLREKTAAVDLKSAELDKVLVEQRDKLLVITGLSLDQAKVMLLE